MYVFETFLAGIHWNALERILERILECVRNANRMRSERKWSTFETQMECERSVRFFFRNSAFFSKFWSQNFDKKCAQNAGNRISEALDFKIF